MASKRKALQDDLIKPFSDPIIQLVSLWKDLAPVGFSLVFGVQLSGPVVFTQSHAIANLGKASSRRTAPRGKVVLTQIKVQRFLCIRADI